MNRRCGSSKPTPTPLNGLAKKPGKTRTKVIEGNADTVIRQTTVKNLPRTASVAGGARRKRRQYDNTNYRKKTPAYRQRGGGGETKKGELKDNTGAKTRKTKVKTLPQATIVAGGGETRGENQHKMERWHNPQSREGCLLYTSPSPRDGLLSRMPSSA